MIDRVHQEFKEQPKQSRVSAALDKCKVSDKDAVHLLTASAESQLNY